MSCRLIAFDLDGTLVNSQKVLTARTYRALLRAHERGILLVPATGRIFPGTPGSLRNAPFAHYFIAVNGALAYDAHTDTALYEAPIPYELAMRALDYMLTLPALYDCYFDNQGYMNRDMLARIPEFVPDEAVRQLMYSTRVPVDDLYSLVKARGGGLQKMQLHFTDMDERARQLRELPLRFPGLVTTTSIPDNIEINSADATKGKALSALCAALGIPIADTVAFGDGSNDCSMLSAAGRGIAMANACEEAKHCADEICPDNDSDGAAQWIEALLDNL